MSENSKDRQLPQEDYYRTYKGDDDRTKRIRTDLSEKEKEEFAKAFSEDDDVKTYTPSKQKMPAPPQKPVSAPPPQSREELYALPEFDSDKFFESLGVPSGATQKVNLRHDSEGETIAFAKEEIVEVHEEPIEDITGRTKPLADTLGNTRYFNLRARTKKNQQDKNRKNFMQNFRVLSKDREDRAILEVAPVGKGGKGLADSVKPGKGEDIFEAVEKAYLKKDETAAPKQEKAALIKERNEKGAVRGAETLARFQKDSDKNRIILAVYAVLFLVSMITTLFFSSKGFYPVLSLVISLVSCGLSFTAFAKSFRAVRSLSAVSDTAVVMLSFFVLLHNLAVLALGQNVSVYTLCAVFACFVRTAAEYYRLRGRIRLVSMALKSRSLSILQRIPVRNEAVSFAKNVSGNDEPDIFYCADALLDVSVEEPEKEEAKENKYYVFSMSFVLFAAIVVGLSGFVTQLTGLSFITALTATVCATFPIMYDPLSRIIFHRNGKELLKQGACISGREALSHIGRSDGFVLDAKDVFAGEVSRFRKSAISKISQTDSAVFAALLMREADSVLAPCFDDFLSQMNITLPEVENFLYEEKLGYSAWVLDRKILVGNRQMLINHSISVPSAEHEKAYGKGRYVMYVVIDGEITATFLVNYKVLSSLRKYARDFNKSGMMIMLSSREAILSEEIVAAKLSLDISSVKVLSSKATAIMDKFNSGIENQTASGLICSKKKRSIMHLIMGCYNSNASDRLILTMMLLGQGIGFVLLLLSQVLGMSLFFNPVAIVVLRLIWSTVIGFVIERKK